MNRGKLTILTILVLAGGLTSFAVWYRHYAGQRCLEYWGAEAAVRIQESQEMELLKLEPESSDSESSDSSGDSIEVQGVRFQIAFAEDISEKSGILHLQRALIEDRSYLWDEPDNTDSTIEWDYVIVFKDKEGISRVGFDLDGPWVCEVSEPSGSRLDATKMAKFLRIFFTGE